MLVGDNGSFNSSFLKVVLRLFDIEQDSEETQGLEQNYFNTVQENLR